MNTPEELKTLKRIEDLLTSLVKTSLAEKLRPILADKQQRFLYENTGRIPVKALAKKMGSSAGAISRTWQKWEDAGLLIKDGKQYRRVI
jgi:hypothetical protein